MYRPRGGLTRGPPSLKSSSSGQELPSNRILAGKGELLVLTPLSGNDEAKRGYRAGAASPLPFSSSVQRGAQWHPLIEMGTAEVMSIVIEIYFTLSFLIY